MLQYYRNILARITLKKAVNYLLLMLSYYLTKLSGRVLMWGKPVFISIEPATACNLRCPQCPSGLREFTRETGMLDKHFFEKTLLQLKGHLHSLTFYFQGEPYLNKEFLNMVAFASSHNIYTITSTNAHYLSAENAKHTVESGLHKLIISVDGMSQETYSKYRIGGHLNKVLEGTREIVRQKRALNSNTPHIIWQFVAFSHNQHEIALVKKTGKEMGVDEVKIKTAQIYDYSAGNKMIPDDERLSRYKKQEDGSYALQNNLANSCLRMWQGCVVTWDGKVVPCCFDKDASHRLGDLQSQEFHNIWHSQAYNSFRKMVMASRKNIDICTNCTEGTRVWS